MDELLPEDSTILVSIGMMSTTVSSIKKKAANPPLWHLVTNHLNALYMMAAGMVMEPAGFKKYYSDS